MPRTSLILIFCLLAVTSLFLSAASKEEKHQVDPKTCIGCALCVQSCPSKAIVMKDGKAIIDPERCINCTLCVQKCPTKAIRGPTVKPAAEKKTK
ncbi:MAG TPA: 4Fe-4S binding protein [bacterium]|nr:4Fe-4S binding protein [bacterium]